MYHAVEAQVESQMAPEARKKFDKQQWRKLMDIIMEHFAKSLVSIVASVANQQAQAKAAAEAAKAAEINPPEAPAPAESAAPIPTPSTAGE